MVEGDRQETLEKGRSGFLSSVLTLGGGAIVAQVVAIVASPLITRLFAPDAFGLAAVVGTVFVIVGPVAAGKYDAAVPLPREDERAASLLGLGLGLTVATTVAVALVMLPLGDWLLGRLGAGAVASEAVWMIPLGIALVGLIAPMRTWYLRHRRFRILAGLEVLQAGTTVAASIGAGLLGFVAGLDLIVARLLSQALIPLWMAAGLLRERAFLARHWRWPAFAEVGRRYADFPRFSVWVDLLNATSRGLPTLLLAGYFGAGTAGLFALANRIVLMPSQLVGRATSQVLFQRVAEMRAHGRSAARLLEQVVGRLALASLLPATALMVAGPVLFAEVFGEDWRDAGRYAAVLSPWILTLMVSSPLSTLWAVFERQRVALVFNVTLLLARAGVLVAGARATADPVVTLALFGAVGVVFNLGMIVYFGRLTGVRFAPLLRELARWAVVAAVCAALPWALQRHGDPSPRLVLAAVAAQAILFGSLVLLLDAELRRLATDRLRRGRRP